jgi:hypothetical protein
LFRNTPLARRFWTGLEDDHLAGIGFVNFAWNILERKFCSLIWVTAGWDQTTGELVTADLGNVSAITLFMNLLILNLKEHSDESLFEQGSLTASVLNDVRADRNDIIHSFFFNDPTKGIGQNIKINAKSRKGQPEIQTIAISKNDIDILCKAMSDCYDSIEDLIHKLYFRRKFLSGERGALARSYEQAVHGWQAPSFDIGRVRSHVGKRSQRSNPPQGSPLPQSSRG